MKNRNTVPVGTHAGDKLAGLRAVIDKLTDALNSGHTADPSRICELALDAERMAKRLERRLDKLTPAE